MTQCVIIIRENRSWSSHHLPLRAAPFPKLKSFIWTLRYVQQHSVTRLKQPRRGSVASFIRPRWHHRGVIGWPSGGEKKPRKTRPALMERGVSHFHCIALYALSKGDTQRHKAGSGGGDGERAIKIDPSGSCQVLDLVSFQLEWVEQHWVLGMVSLKDSESVLSQVPWERFLFFFSRLSLT